MSLWDKLRDFGKATPPAVNAQAPVPNNPSNEVGVINADTIQADNIVQGIQQISNYYYSHAAAPALTPNELNLALKRYLEQVCNDFNAIRVEVLRSDQRTLSELPFERAYVPFQAMPYGAADSGNFAAAYQRLKSQKDRIECDELLSLAPATLLMAETGQGKSIALQRLAYLLANGILNALGPLKNQLGLPQPLPLPIFVSLGLYAQYLNNIATASPLQRSIISYIAESVQASALGLPKDFFELLIRNDQPLVLLLDGLDEVVAESLRAEISQELSRLNATHPQLRMLLTSRPSAYDGRAKAQLMRGFLPMAMLPFERKQIKNLIERAIDASYTDDEIYKAGIMRQIRERSDAMMHSIDALETQRRKLRDDAPPLIDSPLMVRLALIVHSKTGNLPQQRAELLRQATEALLTANYENDERVRNMLERLMHDGWMTQRNMAQALALQMHTAQVSEFSKRALQACLNDLPQYRHLSEAFHEVIKNRGGLLYASGGRYRFLHLALQAWLAASQIAQLPTPQAMVDWVSSDNRLESAWWREVAMLVAGYFAIPHEDYYDEAAFNAYVAALAKHHSNHAASPSSRFAAAELAMQAVHELGQAASPAQTSAAAAFAQLIEHDPAALASAPAHTRVRLGNLLAAFGDPRPHAQHIDPMPLCWVPAGAFYMGSGAPKHKTDDLAFEDECCDDPAWLAQGMALPYDYWIAQYPITNAQYAEFVRDRGYADARWWGIAIADKVWQTGQLTQLFYTSAAKTREEQLAASQNKALTERHEAVSRPAMLEYPLSQAYGRRSWTWDEALKERPNHPMSNATWYEAMAFCAWLTHRWRKAGWLGQNQTVTLPSEPEWEKAARGGIDIPIQPIIAPIQHLAMVLPVALLPNPLSKRRFSWGDDPAPQFANTFETGLESSHPIGCFNLHSSPYGAQDLCGNVWEWTRSKWGEREDTPNYAYPYNTQDGRELPIAGQTMRRVVRGGSWIFNIRSARVAVRYRLPPAFRFNFQGFRVVVVSAPV